MKRNTSEARTTATAPVKPYEPTPKELEAVAEAIVKEWKVWFR